MKPLNLLSKIPSDTTEEAFEDLLKTSSFRIERIVSRGHRSPEGFWYDQDTDEWALLLSGAARLRFEDGEEVALRPGDCLNIPARRKHRVEWTDPERETIWLAIHY